MPIYFLAGGGKIVEGRGCGKGQGGGDRRGGPSGVGQGGWDKGGQGGWNLYINEVLNKTGIVSSNYGVGTHVPRRNRNEIGGISPF